jgi:hypothetical protein
VVFAEDKRAGLQFIRAVCSRFGARHEHQSWPDTFFRCNKYFAATFSPGAFLVQHRGLFRCPAPLLVTTSARCRSDQRIAWQAAGSGMQNY